MILMLESIDPNYVADRSGVIIFALCVTAAFYLQMFAERRIPLIHIGMLAAVGVLALSVSIGRTIHVDGPVIGYFRVAAYLGFLAVLYMYIRTIFRRFKLKRPPDRVCEWVSEQVYAIKKGNKG